MEWKPGSEIDATALEGGPIDLTIAGYLADAMSGDVAALFNLGVAYSTGSGGVDCNFVEAHKWFNLAASKGHESAKTCRQEMADMMSSDEIRQAQRAAREWLKLMN